MYLFLLHQFGIRTIIDHAFAENWGSEGSINLFGVDILQFPIQNKFISFCSEADGCFLPEKYKGEDIAILQTVRISMHTKVKTQAIDFM